jgi:hypothetical protein
MTGPGNCSITASQPGNANYDAATSVTQTFTVNQAAPTRNLIRYSEQLTQWFNNSGATVVDNAFTHNGVSLSLLEDDTPYGFESISQGVTFTGDGEKAVSVFMKAGTTTEYTAVRIYDQTELYANRLFARIRWAAGAPTIDMVYSSGTHLKTDTLGNGFYRFHFRTSPIIAANTHSISLQPTSTWPEDMGSTYFGGIQVENASTPTAYEKTTSVSAGPSMAQSGGNQSGASIRTRTRQ